jgi:hypothetical protein
MASQAARAPFFVVFDTSTHARYYGDVHEVLALPEGGIIRYEYKRYLFQPTAAAALGALVDEPSGLPVDALLMYGQKRSYRQGEPDPKEMLRWGDSVFVPTRSAHIIAVAREPGADARSDVLHFHLEMRGFVDPDSDLLEPMVRALEAGNSLPFGDRDQQHSWISLLPEEIRARTGGLVSDNQQLWSKVVGRLITLPTQFEHDVFWRVLRICEASGGKAPESALPLRDRRTNVRAHTNRWHRDYLLHETKRYEIFVQTYAPGAYGDRVPGDATIVMTSEDDDEGLIKLSANPLAIVPNETSSQRFSIDTNNAIDTRYSGVRLETQVPNRTSPYPAGSMCSLTVAIRKQRWRLVGGVLLILTGTFLVGYTTAAELMPLMKGLLAVAAAILLAAGGWLLTRQFKIGS